MMQDIHILVSYHLLTLLKTLNWAHPFCCIPPLLIAWCSPSYQTLFTCPCPYHLSGSSSDFQLTDLQIYISSPDFPFSTEPTPSDWQFWEISILPSSPPILGLSPPTPPPHTHTQWLMGIGVYTPALSAPQVGWCWGTYSALNASFLMWRTSVVYVCVGGGGGAAGRGGEW